MRKNIISETRTSIIIIMRQTLIMMGLIMFVDLIVGFCPSATADTTAWTTPLNISANSGTSISPVIASDSELLEAIAVWSLQ